MTITDIMLAVAGALYLPIGGWAIKTNSRLSVLESQFGAITKKLDKMDQRQEDLIDHIIRMDQKNGKS